MKKINYWLSAIALIIIISALIIYILPRQKAIIQTPDKKIVYLQQECTPKECERNNFELIEAPASTSVNARVFGTIYEDRDNASIFGTCSNSENKPLESNASITIYNPNSSILVNQTNMSRIDTGIFNLTVGLSTTRGNYLVMLNCSEGSNYAIAYAEFQNPNWVNKLQSILDNIGTTLTSVNSVKDFRIDKLTSVSPIYPNETIFIEATFSDGNGSLITPDEINLTILYPNRTTFITKSKTDFATINNVWNYSEVTLSNQKTGTYYVHLQANDSLNRKSVKTTQFRIATGGPYRLAIDCPATAETGASLNCIVTITDEGEIATESTTVVWLDSGGDGVLDSTEPQVSFSKETVPQQVVTETAAISIPLSHSTGLFIVRVKTSYSGSPQPDSTASDSITIIAKAISVIGAGGGGTLGTSANCNRYILAYNTCYYFDEINGCIKGCYLGAICSKELVCVSSTQLVTTTPIKPKSLLQRFWEWLSLLIGLSTKNPELSTYGGLEPISSNNTEQQPNIQENIKQAFQQNKWLPYIIVGIAILGFTIYVFGWWQPALAFIIGLGAWGYIIILILLVIIYLFLKNF